MNLEKNEIKVKKQEKIKLNNHSEYFFLIRVFNQH